MLEKQRSTGITSYISIFVLHMQRHSPARREVCNEHNKLLLHYIFASFNVCPCFLLTRDTPSPVRSRESEEWTEAVYI